MKKIFALILILIILLTGYAVLKTWLRGPTENPGNGSATLVDTSEVIRQRLKEGEFCYVLSNAECFKVFTGLYDLEQRSFEYGTSTVRATGSFVYWPQPGEYDYASMPRYVENFLVECDLSKDTCRYLITKTIGKAEKKFNIATKQFEDYKNYYHTNTGSDQTFKIFKKDKEMVSAEHTYSPQECGIDRLVLKLRTKEVIRLRSSACKSEDFLTDSQENAM
ncbi:MAG: hypothetical protein RJB39_594 [Candidatus Parcubacteria bacterium]|jgi:hypothetical protein